ncbi:methyl-accepting chemotaxis protein [Pseudohongiella sp. SYSU M77423]|uniref:methyl-accepting chemotaxis protein n=1 Tax=Pseudohongiella sp. SYSU M77423 TaxID=3042312 RepID=UPI002480EC35|nr:methyl-accepting chemotaxis protein [Pseudohongiella sp. SYSU M77423]MDH7942906.1 methyl-accepting chemotaxis protein [Pseudohongiella sp. SYSU M77423]
MNSIKARLMTVVAIGLAAFLVASIIAITMLQRTIAAYEQLVVDQVAIERDVQNINLDFKIQVQEWKNVLLRGADAERRDQYWTRFTELHESIQQRSQSLLQRMHPGDARELVSNFRERHQELYDAYQSGLNAFVFSGFDHTVGDQAVSGIDREPTRLLQEAVDELSAASQQSATSLSASSERLVMLSYLAICVIAGLVLLITHLVISRGFIQPLLDIGKVVERMSHGDFAEPIVSNRKDELGKLSTELSQMQDKVASIIRSVQSEAATLAAASGDINEVSEEINVRTQDSENYTDQVAAAITEMSQTIQEVASNSVQAASAAEQVDQSAQSGIKLMTSTSTAIDSLSTDVQHIATLMNRLQENTSSIGTVLDVIQAIAEQTNLLALNAAIEAARAGEQGRGFAVVADEVRALAQRTQESTTEIQRIISELQNGASAAADAMRHGQTKTSEAVTLASDSQQALNEIGQAIASIKDMITQIATAAEEQSYATDEINRNVLLAVEQAQKSRVAAEKSSGTADDLDKSAKKMTSLVSAFNT